jgi:hypothetical protein
MMWPATVTDWITDSSFAKFSIDLNKNENLICLLHDCFRISVNEFIDISRSS